MSLTNKAIFVIERNLGRDLSLAQIADACGVSRFHLAHAFGEVTGKPVMEYVRARRLTEAARKLQHGADDILAPEDARRDGGHIKLVEHLPRVEAGRIPLIPPRFEQAGELKVVGLGQPCAYEKTDHIPGQWMRFMRDFYGHIENRLGETPTSVTMLGASDDEMIYVCAAGVSAFGTTTRELMRVTVPPASYAVFEHRGHVTELPMTYAAIWDVWFASSDRIPAEASGLERHNATFDPRTGNGGVTIWVPIA